MGVPVRCRGSMARSAAYQVLNQYDICTPGMSFKPILKKYAKLFYYSGSCDISREYAGCCTYDKGEYNAYINRDLAAGQDNFAHAHELGHILLRHFVDFDIRNLSDKQMALLNRESDIFATNLLMPEHLIRKYVITPLSVSDMGYLKNWFGVSWQAFVNRLDELEMQSKKDSELLFEEWNSGKIKKYPPTYCAAFIDYVDKEHAKLAAIDLRTDIKKEGIIL